MTTTTTLLEILQTEYKCELTSLPHGGRPVADLSIPSEKLFQIKDTFFLPNNDDPELEEFLLMYLEALRICRLELERMDTMTDEFCTSYLEALKQPPMPQNSPGQPWTPEDNQQLDSSPHDESQVFVKRKGSNGQEDLVALPAGTGEGYVVHKKRRGNLPKAATNLLKKWVFDHLFHPYPTEEEKNSLSLQTGLSLNQISNWFINARRRILQPMLENVRNQQTVIQGIEPTNVPQQQGTKPHRSKGFPLSSQNQDHLDQNGID